MEEGYERTATQTTGLWLGAALLLATLVLAPPGDLAVDAWRTAGVALLMAVWWATGALPLAATALVPLVAFPLLGIVDAERVGAPYANSTIFLILGGFLLGLGMERWKLHQRIAFNVVARAGREPRRLVLGMMVATALTSMAVSNTSTALMMLPVALSIVAVVAPGDDADSRRFATAILLAVAYSASIGGLGTLIGTPTNAIVTGFMRQNYGQSVSFAQWLVFGLPTVALLIPLAWLVLVRVAFPFRLEGRDGGSLVRARLAELGPASTPEKRVGLVFVTAAALWIGRPWLGQLPGLGGLSDSVISMGAALTLFLVPAGRGHEGRLLHAVDVRRVPWDVLVLFGGGLALAEGIKVSGLSEAVAGTLSALGALPLVALVVAIALLLVFWTEINSNVAAAATAMPVLGAIAAATAYPPLMLLAPAAMAASCAFMLPVATPPNAIVFGTGRVRLPDMMRAGVWLNFASVLVITAVVMLVVPRVLH